MISKLFAKISKKTKKLPAVVEKPKKKEVKLASTRIGEILEYKINIQLDQLPKEFRYISVEPKIQVRILTD